MNALRILFFLKRTKEKYELKKNMLVRSLVTFLFNMFDKKKIDTKKLLNKYFRDFSKFWTLIFSHSRTKQKKHKQSLQSRV